jgi:hypothetical protein
MPDVACSLTHVVLALEETWAMVATLKTAEWDRQARQLRLARSDHDADGLSQ